MKCDVCKAKMDNATAEMDILIKGETIKAINVPALICPECGSLVVKDSIKKQAQAYAKHCKDSTFDYAEKEAEAAAAGAVAAATVVI